MISKSEYEIASRLCFRRQVVGSNGNQLYLLVDFDCLLYLSIASLQIDKFGHFKIKQGNMSVTLSLRSYFLALTRKSEDSF